MTSPATVAAVPAPVDLSAHPTAELVEWLEIAYDRGQPLPADVVFELAGRALAADPDQRSPGR